MKKRYPTRDRLIISPYELGYTEPTPEEKLDRNATSIHHGWFDHARYTGNSIHVWFRNLETNTYPMIRIEHNVGKTALHGVYDAPPVPPDSLMIEVLEAYLAEHGVITCIREKKTRTTYDVQNAQFRHIIRTYQRRVA